METLKTVELGFADEWIDDTGWLHYHHSDDSRHHSDGFGDAPHHTGFWITGLILAEELDPDSSENFYTGLMERLDRNHVMIRHPRTLDDMDRPVVINEDQLMPIVFPIHHFDSQLAQKIVDANLHEVPFWKPQVNALIYRALSVKKSYGYRLLTDLADILDSIFDIVKINKFKEKDDYVVEGPNKYLVNGIDSSIIKSVYRSVISQRRFPTFLSRFNGWLLKSCINLEASFSRYFTLRHNPATDSPPPVHLIWFQVLERF